MLSPFILPVGYAQDDAAVLRQDALLELRRAQDALELAPASAAALARLQRARAALRRLSAEAEPRDAPFVARV